MNLVAAVYELLKNGAIEKDFALRDQIRRSAISIPSNIAEGSGRSSEKELNRFLDISLGSSFELETQIIIAHKLEFITDDEFDDFTEKVQEEQKMITGLQKSLNK